MNKKVDGTYKYIVLLRLLSSSNELHVRTTNETNLGYIPLILVTHSPFQFFQPNFGSC